jgi:ribose transport system substrate-binding protein/inositol transport system substrate-binding protein
MRKLFIGVAATAVIALAAGCTPATSAQPAGTASGPARDTKSISLFMTHMSNEFTITLSSAVEAQVAARGYQYKVYDAAQDAAKQQTQIEQAVSLGVGAIVIEPVSVDGIVPAVRAAKAAGVKVVIVNQKISDPSAANAYVGADNVATGKAVMDQASADLGGKGDLALLLGPMGSDGQVGRSEGFQKVIDANAGFKVVFQDAANWETEPALSLVENWLNSGKNIDAIISQNDGMAVGAAKAVSDKKLTGKIKIYGVDATSEGLQAVLDGKLAATIGQGTAQQGTLAADAAADLLEGKTVEAETIVPNDVYTKANAQAALDALKK